MLGCWISIVLAVGDGGTAGAFLADMVAVAAIMIAANVIIRDFIVVLGLIFGVQNYLKYVESGNFIWNNCYFCIRYIVEYV